MAKYGLSFQDKIVEAGIFMEDGMRMAEQLIAANTLPDAVFCFNDPVAIGAMELFKEKDTGFRTTLPLWVLQNRV